MKSNHSPEPFPILTIFCLIFLAYQIGLGAIYLWAAGEPTTPAISVSLARVFTAVGLPSNSLVPLTIDGRTYNAGQWLVAAATPAGLNTLRASQWLLFHLPPVSLFLSLVLMLAAKKWTSKKRPKLVRGVRVIKR